MFEKVLVANRGEIARRIIRTLDGLGVGSVVVHSEVDADLPFVRAAGEAVVIPGPPQEAYRNIDAIIDAALATGAQAIHPGYGFLSEVAEAAAMIEKAGLVWIGPRPETIETMGDKIGARNLATAAGVPVLPGSPGPVPDETAALELAARIGYPVMVKASAGGGGMGLQVAHDEPGLRTAFHSVQSFAERSLNSTDVLIERFVARARHIEVQVFGLGDGRVICLGDRDCSVQRRNQKLVEESPAPGLSADVRRKLHESAMVLAERIHYRSAGTVECLFDLDRDEFYFLEMNTRLQVEHPVTEAVYGVDLVEMQLRLASGDDVAMTPVAPQGHAMEFRINAEELPHFLPRPGTITALTEPTDDGVRIDGGFAKGDSVSPFYDSLIAKLIVHGADRSQTIVRARRALDGYRIEGPGVNIDFHRLLLANADFCAGAHDTTVTTQVVSHA